MTQIVDEILRDYIILSQKRPALDHEGLLDNLVGANSIDGNTIFKYANNTNKNYLKK